MGKGEWESSWTRIVHGRITPKVRGYKQGELSSWTLLSSGSFTKYAVAQAYDSPTLIVHPSITSDGAVGTETTLNGFAVTIPDLTAWKREWRFKDFEAIPDLTR